MKYLRSVKGCIRLDHIKNEDIRQQLKVQPVTVHIRGINTFNKC